MTSPAPMKKFIYATVPGGACWVGAHNQRGEVFLSKSLFGDFRRPWGWSTKSDRAHTFANVAEAQLACPDAVEVKP
jgi:hypothetical protein